MHHKNRRELIQRLVAREPVERSGFWLGWPHAESWEILHRYFGTSGERELREKLGDDVRWIGAFRVYNDPSGRGMFDPGHGKFIHANTGPLSDFTTIEEIAAWHWPNPDYLDFSGPLQELREAGDIYRLSGMWTCFFHTLCDLFGMEDYFMKMLTDPELVAVATDKVCEFYYEANERFFTAAGKEVDALFMGNDLGSQLNLLCGIEPMERFFLPWLKRFADQAHRHGHQVFMHSCGAIHPLIEKIIAAGVDCLHPLQARAVDMDAATLARDFKGRIAFMGGIDSQGVLTSGTPGQVRADVKRVRELLGPNVIISPSHESILPNMPPENIEAMALAAREFAS